MSADQAPDQPTTAAPIMRFASARDAFLALPEIAEDIEARPGGQSSLQFLDELRRSAVPEDAITFCAYVIPVREAVWWGHQCVLHSKYSMTAHEQDVLDLVEQWVADTSERSRYAVMDRASPLHPRTPAVWVGLGAAWSGGSLTAPDQPATPPAPHFTPRALNAGVLGALALVGHQERRRVLSDFVDIGKYLMAPA